MQLQLLQHLDHAGGAHHSDTVVSRAGAKIPGIEVPRHHDVLIGAVGTRPVGNHVVAIRIGQCLRCQQKLHADLPRPGQAYDQVGILSRQCGCRDRRLMVLPPRSPGVW